MLVAELSSLDGPWPDLSGGVATLGVFDGVHLGHRRLLDRLCAVAREERGPSVVLTFAVHPVVVVRGLPPRLITSLPHRLRLFAEHGLDAAVVLPFDAEVRELEAEEFAARVFVRGLRLRGLVLGPDARIGKDRRGDLPFLRAFCGANGLRLEVVDDLEVDGQRVSSTHVRAAIADGDLERARRMLGRGATLYGTVVRGVGRGRALGFATANLDLHHEIRPPPGVYAVRVCDGATEHGGVLNIGVRPTFGPDGDLTVEVHVLDFKGDLYGRDLEVELVERLRDEARFERPEALQEQVAADVAAARRALRTV